MEGEAVRARCGSEPRGMRPMRDEIPCDHADGDGDDARHDDGDGRADGALHIAVIGFERVEDGEKAAHRKEGCNSGGEVFVRHFHGSARAIATAYTLHEKIV